MPEHMSGCSGKISLPSGRSMDLQIHHHVRHTFRDIQVLPESLLRIAGMHENGIPAKICSEALCFSLLPPPSAGRPTHSVRPAGYFCSASAPSLQGRVVPGRARRRKTAYLRRTKKADTYSPGRQALSVPRRGVGADGCPVACFFRGLEKKRYESAYCLWLNDGQYRWYCRGSW